VKVADLDRIPKPAIGSGTVLGWVLQCAHCSGLVWGVQSPSRELDNDSHVIRS